MTRIVTTLVILGGLSACGGEEEQVIDQRTKLSCARDASYHGTYHRTTDSCPVGVTLPLWQDRVVVEALTCSPKTTQHQEQVTLASNCSRSCSWESKPIAGARDEVKGTLKCDVTCPSWASGAHPDLVGKTCSYAATYVARLSR